MQCPHCGIQIHAYWINHSIIRNQANTGWELFSTDCPNCHEMTFELKDRTNKRFRVYPIGTNRGPTPPEVPIHIAQDYKEACIVFTHSPKASAALSRRCLQTMLHEHGYKNHDLAKEIDLLLNESDPRKAIPESLRNTIDGILNFGNFSAHPITDLTSLQIIDVEPHEAEWCLDIVEEMFQHYYVRPALAKKRKDDLDTKLKAAGKPPSK